MKNMLSWEEVNFSFPWNSLFRCVHTIALKMPCKRTNTVVTVIGGTILLQTELDSRTNNFPCSIRIKKKLNNLHNSFFPEFQRNCQSQCTELITDTSQVREASIILRHFKPGAQGYRQSKFMLCLTIMIGPPN